jgi:hypothetical protein
MSIARLVMRLYRMQSGPGCGVDLVGACDASGDSHGGGVGDKRNLEKQF